MEWWCDADVIALLLLCCCWRLFEIVQVIYYNFEVDVIVMLLLLHFVFGLTHRLAILHKQRQDEMEAERAARLKLIEEVSRI